MDKTLIIAIITITLAFVFYTIGVWSEKIQGRLKAWHLVIFIIGFTFDVLGTHNMSKLTEDTSTIGFHAITGFIAILLMLAHIIWAGLVYFKGNEEKKIRFHKISIFVWLIWLIPYLSGMIFGMIG